MVKQQMKCELDLKKMKAESAIIAVNCVDNTHL